MKKPELWQLLIDKNPSFLTGPIEFTPEKLQRFFELVWTQAERHTLASKMPKGSCAQSLCDDKGRSVFEQMFGKTFQK